MIAPISRVEELPHFLVYKFEVLPLTHILTQVLVEDLSLELGDRARPLQILLLVVEQVCVDDPARLFSSEMIFVDPRLHTVLQVIIKAVLLVVGHPLA